MISAKDYEQSRVVILNEHPLEVISFTRDASQVDITLSLSSKVTLNCTYRTKTLYKNSLNKILKLEELFETILKILEDNTKYKKKLKKKGKFVENPNGTRSNISSYSTCRIQSGFFNSPGVESSAAYMLTYTNGDWMDEISLSLSDCTRTTHLSFFFPSYAKRDDIDVKNLKEDIKVAKKTLKLIRAAKKSFKEGAKMKKKDREKNNLSW